MSEDQNISNNKIIISIVAGVIMLFFGMFIKQTWAIGSQGLQKANDNAVRITRLETAYDVRLEYLSKTIDEIKAMLKEMNK